MINNRMTYSEEEKELILKFVDEIGHKPVWADVASILNDKLGRNSSKNAYRNFYDRHKYNTTKSSNVEMDREDPSKLMDTYLEKKIELEKAKVKMRDQRNAFNKVIRDESRREFLEEIVQNEIKNLKPYLMQPMRPSVSSNKELIICLNDIHWGIEFKNYWNMYNPQIAKQRLDKYLVQIREARDTFNINACYLTLGGDNISGNIHYKIAIQNRETVVHQVIGVSELISWFTAQLAGMFQQVKIIGVAGNHSRINPDKSQAPNDERLDDIIPWYMKARLQNIRNVEIQDYSMDNSFSIFKAKENNYLLVHGDYDKKDSIHRVLEMIPASTNIRAILMAHKHHNSLSYKQNQQVVASGSLMGVDEYCIEKRIMGRAQQVLCIVDETGIVYIRDCDLQEV